MFIKKSLKKFAVLIVMIALSTLVAADCASDCEEEYTDCLRKSQSVGKEKICASILHECKLKCAMDG